MKALFQIAYKNFILNIKKSILLGFTIFICALLLLISRTSMNGVEKQVIRNYRNVQVGDMIVMWKPLKEADVSSPQRFINVYQSLSYNPEETNKNEASLMSFDIWMKENESRIQNSFYTIRRNAVMEIGEKTDQNLIIYSLDQKVAEFFVDSKSILIKEGSLWGDGNTICISEEKADNLGIAIGDKITVLLTSSRDKLVTREMEVTGIYQNGAFYENYYGFVSNTTAMELFEIENGYFDSVMVHFRQGEDIQKLTDELETELREISDVLYAESYMEANTYYNNTPQIMKLVFQAFVIFLLAIIAVGMQSTVRMNLYQRMKEFGTLRAIGFSRGKSYLIVFLEKFFVAAFASLIALILSIVYTAVLGREGVYVGPAASALFGGERFYPEMSIVDAAVTFGVIVIFSLVSTIRPGMNLCYQNILDIINKKPKRIHAFLLFMKGIGN